MSYETKYVDIPQSLLIISEIMNFTDQYNRQEICHIMDIFIFPTYMSWISGRNRSRTRTANVLKYKDEKIKNFLVNE